MLAGYGISREQLVDLAILVGTAFNAGIKGIGPKKALKLVQEHGRVESMPEAIRAGVDGYEAVRDLFLRPRVSDDYRLTPGAPDEDGVLRFLSDECEFSKERVTAALQRVRTSA
jgi:flap endonuclease-1